MTEKPTDISDIDTEELRSILLNRTRASRVGVEAYLNYCVHDQPLYIISDEMGMNRSTIIENISKVQSIIEDILTVSETVTDLEDVGVHLRGVPRAVRADEQPEESAFVIKYNSTFLSHGGIDNRSYPCVDDDITEDDMYEGGKGTDRFLFDLGHFIETDPDRAAELYAKITAKTYQDHIFAEEYEQLVKEVSKYVLRSSSDLAGGKAPMASLHSDVSGILPDLLEGGSNTGSDGDLGQSVDEELMKPDMGRKIPEIFDEHSHHWLSADLITSDNCQLESYNLFFTPSERRPFRTAAIFTTVVGRCLREPKNGPYKIIIQQGGWVVDMLGFISTVVCEPEISRIVLIDDPVDGNSVNIDDTVAQIQESISNRVRAIETNHTPCNEGQREYIEVTADKITRSCWNKDI